MIRLQLSLFGPFQAELDARPLVEFESNKVRALLILLIAEPAQPHSRDALAELLWPEQAGGIARANLRHALANLRQVLDDHHADPPFLLINSKTLQLNPAADVDVDLIQFLALTAGLAGTASAPPPVEACRQAVELHRGSLLAGFFVDGSPEFEAWLTVLRERVNRRLMGAYSRLAGHSIAEGDFTQAVAWARRRVALEPWNEEAHRQVMALLAVSGQRAAALRHLASCTQQLAAELDIEPDQETLALAERIREGVVDRSSSKGWPRSFNWPTPYPTERRGLFSHSPRCSWAGGLNWRRLQPIWRTCTAVC